MLDEQRFVYWAAIERSQATQQLPDDIQTMVLTGGLYVTCEVPNLAALSSAFMAMLYSQWPQTQSQYQLNKQSPCFELYSMNWQLEDPLAIYAPVITK